MLNILRAYNLLFNYYTYSYLKKQYKNFAKYYCFFPRQKSGNASKADTTAGNAVFLLNSALLRTAGSCSRCLPVL